MNRKTLYALGTLVILAFAGYAFSSFQESITPYVPYDKARSVDRVVQVAGGLVQGSTEYDREAQSLLFTLEEEESGDTMRVRYHGVKPGNFEDAISIVAIGRFTPEAAEFHADKLLVKCPSKYQGVEETKSYG